MSLLNSVVEKLLENKNRVILDPHQKRAVMSIDAVVLASFRGQAFQLLFSKEFDAPLVWDGEVHYNPEARSEELIPVVYVCDEFHGLLNSGYGRAERGWKDANELFTLLLTRVRGGLEILEFAATRPTYPILFDDCLEVFDNRPGFEDSNGLFHHSRMLIQLRPDNNGLESLRFQARLHDSRSGEKVSSGKLETGNILMWSQLNNSIHWVTRGVDGMVRSLGSAGDAKDYDAFLQWGRRFSVKGWTVGDLIPMPYSLPKASPREEPKVDPDLGDVAINAALQQLLNNAPATPAPATVVLLDAIFRKYFQPVKPVDRSAEYEQLAGDTILEYSAGKSASIIKALNEVKILITAAFVKKSNSEQK
jgi:hypothetical protein